MPGIYLLERLLVLLELEITEGYGVRAITIEGLLLQRFTLRKFHLTDGQNRRDQMSGRRSKRP